jgi:PIN domain-containing protein
MLSGRSDWNQSLEIVNEATHKFMLAEARSKGLITAPGNAKQLRQNFSVIPTLIDYSRETERILALNLLFVSTNEQIVRSAQSERDKVSLLTNDSMVMACMREYGIQLLATADRDFDRANGITVFGPDDL